MARGGATNQRDAARGLGVLAPGGEHHPASCPAGKVLCLDGAYPGGWTRGGGDEWQRHFATTQGPHEIAPPSGSPRNRASDPGAQGKRASDPGSRRKRASDFVGWFRGVVSWGGLVRRSCRLDSAGG